MIDDEAVIETPITVGVVLRLTYHGDPAGFNPEDVRELAIQGVESHYDVTSSEVDSWTQSDAEGHGR